MFSFCKLLYLYMFRCGAREAVRGASCFPTDRADLHRCRSGAACFPTDRADLHRCRSGCFLFSRRSRRFAQMPFGVLLVFPQIAQICTDAVRGGLIPQIAPRRGRCHRCRSGCFLFSRRLRRFAQMPVRGASCFPHRLRRWRQGVSVSFVTMLHVTCYNKVVPYCAGWALRNYIVYILFI